MMMKRLHRALRYSSSGCEDPADMRLRLSMHNRKSQKNGKWKIRTTRREGIARKREGSCCSTPGIIRCMTIHTASHKRIREVLCPLGTFIIADRVLFIDDTKTTDSRYGICMPTCCTGALRGRPQVAGT
jgi:hypothetical protein